MKVVLLCFGVIVMSTALPQLPPRSYLPPETSLIVENSLEASEPHSEKQQEQSQSEPNKNAFAKNPDLTRNEKENQAPSNASGTTRDRLYLSPEEKQDLPNLDSEEGSVITHSPLDNSIEITTGPSILELSESKSENQSTSPYIDLENSPGNIFNGSNLIPSEDSMPVGLDESPVNLSSTESLGVSEISTSVTEDNLSVSATEGATNDIDVSTTVSSEVILVPRVVIGENTSEAPGNREEELELQNKVTVPSSDATQNNTLTEEVVNVGKAPEEVSGYERPKEDNEDGPYPPRAADVNGNSEQISSSPSKYQNSTPSTSELEEPSIEISTSQVSGSTSSPLSNTEPTSRSGAQLVQDSENPDSTRQDVALSDGQTSKASVRGPENGNHRSEDGILNQPVDALPSPKDAFLHGTDHNAISEPGSREAALGSATIDALEPVSYQFSYAVYDPPSGLDFGHQERRQGDNTEGRYYVVLPGGSRQVVTYVADRGGYRPVVRYEGSGGGTSQLSSFIVHDTSPSTFSLSQSAVYESFSNPPREASVDPQLGNGYERNIVSEQARFY